MSVDQVEKNLMRVKPGKAPGPDGITSWMLRDLAPILAAPITSLFNASIRDGYVPSAWKSSLVFPLLKKSPPKSIESDLRPVSLTSLLAKELERFVVSWIKQVTDDKIGDLQFGNAKGVSTTHMLVKILDAWQKAVDKPNTAVRIVFLDFAKAFDSINHNLLMEKFSSFGVPPILQKWIAAFLHNRCQRVKLGDVISKPLILNGAIPQGAIIGMEGFVVMIDDLDAPHPIFKYIDDSTHLRLSAETRI